MQTTDIKDLLYYNGYVGYMKYSRRFYRANFEEQVLNIYRRAC